MALWQRIKRFSRSLVILAISCLVLEQVLYSVVVPGYFLGVLISRYSGGLSLPCAFICCGGLILSFAKKFSK